MRDIEFLWTTDEESSREEGYRLTAFEPVAPDEDDPPYNFTTIGGIGPEGKPCTHPYAKTVEREIQENTVVGYVSGGGDACVHCTDRLGLLEEEDDLTFSPLYDGDPAAIRTCTLCGGWIVEPECEECGEDHRTEDHSFTRAQEEINER